MMTRRFGFFLLGLCVLSIALSLLALYESRNHRTQVINEFRKEEFLHPAAPDPLEEDRAHESQPPALEELSPPCEDPGEIAPVPPKLKKLSEQKIFSICEQAVNIYKEKYYKSGFSAATAVRGEIEDLLQFGGDPKPDEIEAMERGRLYLELEQFIPPKVVKKYREFYNREE